MGGSALSLAPEVLDRDRAGVSLRAGEGIPDDALHRLRRHLHQHQTALLTGLSPRLLGDLRRGQHDLRRVRRKEAQSKAGHHGHHDDDADEYHQQIPLSALHACSLLSARTALCPEFLRLFGPQAEFPLNGVGDPAAGEAVAVGIDGVGHGGVGRRSGE